MNFEHFFLFFKNLTSNSYLRMYNVHCTLRAWTSTAHQALLVLRVWRTGRNTKRLIMLHLTIGGLKDMWKVNVKKGQMLFSAAFLKLDLVFWQALGQEGEGWAILGVRWKSRYRPVSAPRYKCTPSQCGGIGDHTLEEDLGGNCTSHSCILA